MAYNTQNYWVSWTLSIVEKVQKPSNSVSYTFLLSLFITNVHAQMRVLTASGKQSTSASIDVPKNSIQLLQPKQR
jgi:hypothetical protein